MKTALLVVTAAFVALVAPLQAQDDPLTRERDQQTGTAITILFDNSGSMKQDNKIGQAKSAFRSWLQSVPSDYKFSLITFDDNGRLAVPLGEKNRDIIAQKVAQLEARTSTPICGALKIARQQIEKRRREVTPYERHVVVVFTDGEETVDKRGVDGVRKDIAALRKQTVEVVGVGFHGQGDYMRDVATRFALANSEEELKKGLAKVDAEVGNVDDIVISADDLAAMKKADVAPLKAVSTAPAEAQSTSEQQEPESAPPSAPMRKEKGIQMRWVIFFVVVFIVIRRIIGHHNRKS